MKSIRWGILATGGIAHALAQALQDVPDSEITAVASRTLARAETFGDKYGIPNRYGSYEELAADPTVDVIYIATPHSEHYDNMRLCLQAGKHVLCEKAFTLNAKQAAECIELARSKGLFLMEAMWMRFNPAITQLRQWINDEIIGEIKLVQADFRINLPFDPEHRLYNPLLGGGALLDLGIYPLSFTTMLLGFPVRVQSQATLGQTGVDEQDVLLLTYEDGATAVLGCGMRAQIPFVARVVGTKGHIIVHDIFFRPDQLTLSLIGQEPQIFHIPYRGNGYIHEVEEVNRCLRAGELESEIMPLDETLALMSLMDDLRAEWGVVYPQEQTA